MHNVLNNYVPVVVSSFHYARPSSGVAAVGFGGSSRRFLSSAVFLSSPTDFHHVQVSATVSNNPHCLRSSSSSITIIGLRSYTVVFSKPLQSFFRDLAWYVRHLRDVAWYVRHHHYSSDVLVFGRVFAWHPHIHLNSLISFASNLFASFLVVATVSAS